MYESNENLNTYTQNAHPCIIFVRTLNPKLKVQEGSGTAALTLLHPWESSAGFDPTLNQSLNPQTGL